MPGDARPVQGPPVGKSASKRNFGLSALSDTSRVRGLMLPRQQKTSETARDLIMAVMQVHQQAVLQLPRNLNAAIDAVDSLLTLPNAGHHESFKSVLSSHTEL